MYSQTRSTLSICLFLAIVACVLVGDAMAGGKGKGEDIILYNGNIVLRGGKGKGKGGSIIVANGPSSSMDIMPDFNMWGGFGRKRR